MRISLATWIVSKEGVVVEGEGGGGIGGRANSCCRLGD